MQRYFLDDIYGEDGSFVLTGEDFHHISRVMRMRPGDQMFAVFADGRSALARLEKLEEEFAVAAVVEWEERASELPVRITIASGLPKGDKLELILQKGTELGAAEFVPFIAARSIVKWEPKKAGKKAERWRKIAREAAEQSHRCMLPNVSEPVSFKRMIELSSSCTHKVAAYEEEAKQGEKSRFARVLHEASPGDSIFIAFGPEGGFSPKEMEQLMNAGFVSCGLGPRILRTETAPLYALSAISYHYELMG